MFGFAFESKVTFSICTCAVAPFVSGPVCEEGVFTEINGLPAATLVPRSIVRIFEPKASVGALIARFVLISKVLSRVITTGA